ncbi:MAG: hypothetical protein GY930_17670 [bacterium]|nr:hypothetical protein [bacterium]
MHKWILLVVFAALALGSVLYLTQGSEEHGLESLENGELRQTERVPDDPKANLRGLGGGGTDQAGGSSTGSSGPGKATRSALGIKLTAATAGGDFHVLLQEPKNSTPVEGMRVYLLDRDRLGPDEWRLAGSNMRDLRKLIKYRGVMQESDVEGGAYFERALDGAIWAEGAGWQGFFDWIGPTESPLVLPLSPHSELEVLALDKDGVPMRGVPMAVLSKKPGHWVAFIKRSTLGTGLAQFSGVSAFSARATKDVPLVVGFHFPHQPRVWHEIDPEWLPEDPIEMRVPPHAPLTIRVLDGEGNPVEGSFMMGVGMPVEEQGKRVTPIVSRRCSKGEASFAMIGKGASLRVQLTGHPELKDLVVDLLGPANGEEDAVREIPWFEKRLRVIGQLRGPGGIIANRQVRASWGTGRSSRSVPITTDAQGNFSVTMDGLIGGNLHLMVRATDNDAPSEGHVVLPQSFPNGEWDAGLVPMKGQPLFAEGRVLDLSRQPIDRAMVRVEKWMLGTPPGRGKKSGGDSQDGEKQKSKGATGRSKEGLKRGQKKGYEKRGYWGLAGNMIAMTNEQGRFKIYGKAHSKKLRLSVSRRGYLPQSIEEVQAGMPPWYFNMEPGEQANVGRTKTTEEDG